MRRLCAKMVVRSAQKELGDVQRIREAMEGNRPVVTAGQRELIIQQANITGEDGAGMVEDIEDAAANNKMLPADVFKMIDKCMTALGQKAKRRVQADRMVAEKEPERLKQIEAIREQATMLHASRLNRDKLTEESVARVMREAVVEYMAAVDQDVVDGLDPDAAREWKERAQEIVTLANLDMPAAGTKGHMQAVAPQEGAAECLVPIRDVVERVMPAVASQEGAAECLVPLRDAIERARLTANAASRELNDPEETVLRGFGRQLGDSRKEIMALSKSLAVGQPASMVAEATRLSDEACENIRLSRELIRAALRDMGAASDISEASGPVRTRPAAQGESLADRRPTVPLPAGPRRPLPREGEQRPPPARAASGGMWADWAPQHTPANASWAPMGSLPRPNIRDESSELTAIMRGMMNAQANDDGWPTFSGKYVEFPRFRKEWWAYRQTYHGHVRDELVCRSLKEKSLASSVRLIVNDIDDLREVWNTLNTCYDKPGRYISEALDPIIKFRAYKPFDSGAVREFYSLLRAAMMGARKAGILEKLINDQTLPGILGRMPPMDWRQWARERPDWSREPAEEAFWKLVDQKWKDSINVAAAEPPAWGIGGGGGRANPQGTGAGMKEAGKLAKAGAAAIHVTEAVGRRAEHGEGRRPCIFKEVLGCGGTHPPWFCRAFGRLPAKERERLIVDNKLCPFCLLHDKEKPCGAKQKPISVACGVPGCKGRHVQKLHEALKDIFREEGRVHVLQEDDGWEESDGAWELEEAGEMIVGAVRQEDECSWSETCDAWTALDEEAEVGVHQVEAEEMGDSEADQGEGLLIEGEEREYVLELLLREDPLEAQAGSQPTNTKPASSRDKKKKNSEKKPHKRVGMVKEAVAKAPMGSVKEATCGKRAEHASRGLPSDPETKGGGAVREERGEDGQPTPPLPTLGGECSA